MAQKNQNEDPQVSGGNLALQSGILNQSKSFIDKKTLQQVKTPAFITNSHKKQQSETYRPCTSNERLSRRQMESGKSKEKKSISINSQQSIVSMIKNNYGSASSKALLTTTTMHSQNNNLPASCMHKQYSTEGKNGMITPHANNRKDFTVAVQHFQSLESKQQHLPSNHIYFTKTKYSKTEEEQEDDKKVKDGHRDSEHVQFKQLQVTPMTQIKSPQIIIQDFNQENDSRRESMTSFKDSDISEGFNVNQLPREITKYQFNRQIHMQMKDRNFEILSTSQSYNKQPSTIKMAIIDMSEKQRDLKVDDSQQKDNFLVISRIDLPSHILQNDSKTSIELENILMNISNISRKTQLNSCGPLTKQVSLNASAYLPIKLEDKFQCLDDDSIRINQNERQKFPPIMLNFNKNENDVSEHSQASQSIKNYLSQLKSLKRQYQDIIQELQQEENMNIQQTTMQILSSETFRRMSIRSGTEFLSSKIIEIRDEYRHVLNLLKSQHKFSEIPNDEDEDCTSFN